MQPHNIDYNDKIVDHFLNPRNIGEIEKPDGHAVVGDPSCGDHIRVWIRVQDEKIIEFKYKVFGCWGAISTTSVVSEMAVGKSLKEATTLTDDDVIHALGGIPENKKHCSLLGIQGLRAAVAEFLLNDNHKKYDSRIAFYQSHGYDIPVLRTKMAGFLDGLPADAKILEVGTGKGHLALAIAGKGRSCVSVDLSEDEIYMAKLNAIYFKADERIDLRIEDAKALSFDSDSYDAVLSAAFMHHLVNPQNALNEMLRVCKSNGKIILSDLNENGLALMDKILKQDGKIHSAPGWPLKKVQQWFENKGFKISRHPDDLETMIVINFEN